ncbi:MAG: serine/threonine-protein phosphatase [Chloroflexi bacterium]|nr:MAG: serine/threonine-protein phosphatase [Chloroflexota bacterium]
MEFLRRILGRPATEQTPANAVETTSNEGKSKEKKPPQPNPLPDTGTLGPMGGVTRPLPPEPLAFLKEGRLSFGISSHVGMVRGNNQDAAMAFLFASTSANDLPDIGLFIIADGMGGHFDGEKASALASKMVTDHVINQVYLPILKGTDFADLPPINEIMMEAAQKANVAIIEQVPNAGTTLTAAVLIGDLAHIVHVGDSRCYLITNDNMDQLTRDHSLVQRLIELEQLTPEEAESHPQKNILYRAIGQNDVLEFDTMTRRLPPNSYLLLCSDGLWGLVEDEDMKKIIKSSPNPQAACDQLVALANANGGVDNISVILLKVPSK